MRISDWSSDVCSSDLSCISARSAVSLLSCSTTARLLLPIFTSLNWMPPALNARSALSAPSADTSIGSSLHSPPASAPPPASPAAPPRPPSPQSRRSEEHTSELQSLMRISYAVFCLKKKNKKQLAHAPLTQTHLRTLTHTPTY